MRAAAYLRVSTEEQAIEGFSLDTQKTDIVKRCNDFKYEIVDFYNDDGYSAKDMKRPGLQRLLSDVQAKRVDVVVFWRLDRFTRKTRDFQKMMEIFDKYNVGFHSVKEKFDTTTAMGRFQLDLTVSLGQLERETTAERVRYVMEDQHRKGNRQGAAAPFGYDLVEGKLVVNPVEAEVVRRIFTLYQQNKSFRAIAKLFNKENVPKRKAQKWAEFTVGYIITNPEYCGKLRWNYRKVSGKPTGKEIIVDSDHEPIVSVEEFERVQQMKENRARFGKRVTSDFTFTGVLKCSRCGYNMIGVTHKRKESNVRYYRCLGRFNYGVCDMPMIKEETVTRLFLDALQPDSDKLRSLVVVNDVVPTDQDEKQEQLRKELEVISRRKRKWQEAFADEAMELADFKARMAEEKQKEEYVLSQLEVAPSMQSSITREEVLRLLSSFHTFWYAVESDAAKKNFVQGVFEEITIKTIGEEHTPSPGSFVPIEIVDWRLKL